MQNPDSFCYCPRFDECAVRNDADDTYDNARCQSDDYGCVDGLIHVGKCLGGPSIAMSAPHFYYADPKLVRDFTGLKPVQDLHDSFLDVEPITGLVVRGHKRMQVRGVQYKNFEVNINISQQQVSIPISISIGAASLEL